MPLAKLDPKAVLAGDPWLEPFVPAIVNRFDKFATWKDTIEKSEDGYDAFSKGYLKFGLNAARDGTITYREWAPNAVTAHLVGDFSQILLSMRHCIMLTSVRCMGSHRPSHDKGWLRRLGNSHPCSQRLASHTP